MSAPLPQPTLEYPDARPTDRAGCLSMPRPCPFLSCRHHLALDIGKRGRLNPYTPALAEAIALLEVKHPADANQGQLGAAGREANAALFNALHGLPQTCALDVADAGEHTLDQIGEAMGGISRERVRQIEQSALEKLKRFGIVIDLAEDEGLDTDTAAPLRPKRPLEPRETDPDFDGTYIGGFQAKAMTAKMLEIKAESAPPVRTLSPDAIDLNELEAQIRAKQAPPRTNTNARVTQDLFARPPSPERTARAKESLQSYRRINPTPVKAHTTTPPRPPSPPTPPPSETPPQVSPALVQSDDHREVAVVSALPDPTPPPKAEATMSSPKPRSHWRKQQSYAIARIQAEMASRGIIANTIATTIAAAHPELRVTSAVGSVNILLGGGGSPTSVWFRRVAIALGLTLSDLCDDPAWLAEVRTEEAPVVAHSPARSVALPPPPKASIPTREDALAPLLLAALDKAQALDKRTAELTAVVGILRAEIDDLQKQLATAKKERDEARKALTQIDAALSLTRKAAL